MNKKTVILGATTQPDRYAYIAAGMLHDHNVPFVPVGIKKGEVYGNEILDIKQKPEIKDVHTVTMYLGAPRQIEWYDYILSLQPKRIIFNPGAENAELAAQAIKNGIESVEACTLVMLRTNQF